VTQRTNERGERTRKKLLDAGMDLIRELTPAQLLEALSAKVVTRHVGMTTGAFYAHFPDHASYIDALLEHGLTSSDDELQIQSKTFEMFVAYANAPDTHLVDDFLEIVETNFQWCVETVHVFDFLALLWGRRGDPRVRELLQARYKKAMDEYVVAEQMIADRWNVQYREPLDMRTGAELMNAFFEGVIMRHCIDPDVITPNVYSHAMLAFLTGAVKPVGANDDAEHVFDVARRSGIRDWEPKPDERPSDSIVAAASALLESIDMDACSIEAIAEKAGVTKEQVDGTWGSRARLATAVVHRVTEPLVAQHAFDVNLPMAASRALDRQLGRLASIFVDMARSRPALLSFALRGSIEHLTRPSKKEGSLGLALVPAIEAAQADGTINADFDAQSLARTIAFDLASRALEGPDDPADVALASARALLGLKPKAQRRANATARRAAG
jgi:AcrR family transcriptional regulator